MTTQLTVSNLALAHLAIGRPIAAVKEATQPARVMLQFYDQARDEVFRGYNWPFARKFLSLTKIAGPTPRACTDFAYGYRYPDDCLAARTLRNGPQRPPVTVFDATAQFPLTPGVRVPFIIGRDDTARLIFTDAEPVAASGDWHAFPELEYTVLVEEEDLWPPDFVSALSFLLAWYAAPTLTAGDSHKLGMRARAAYEDAIGRAWRSHLTEQEVDPDPDSAFISARN